MEIGLNMPPFFASIEKHDKAFSIILGRPGSDERQDFHTEKTEDIFFDGRNSEKTVCWSSPHLSSLTCSARKYN